MITFPLKENQHTDPREIQHLTILPKAKAAARRTALSWLRVPSGGAVPGPAPPPGHPVSLIPSVAPLGHAVITPRTSPDYGISQPRKSDNNEQQGWSVRENFWPPSVFLLPWASS